MARQRPSYRSATIVFLMAVMVFHYAGMAWAAEAGPRSLRAERTEVPPVIDGVLNDPCWAPADVATGFTNRKTDKPATEQTRVRVLYDDHNLYVAFDCEESQTRLIQATERKDDRFLDADDTVGIQVDTFHDHRNTYTFIANTLRTRFDARYGVFGPNSSWDCNWIVACSVGEGRWYAEFAIPLGELLFHQGTNVTWGINFHRDQKPKQETSTWSYRPDSRQYAAASEAGELVGLDLSTVKVTRRPHFEAYVSGTATAKGGESEASAGVDITTRLTPQITSALTLNPDFGQIEADADTIELLDTERFLPERRPFFREGSELFNLPIDVYYSRRFVNIDAGAKVTGTGSDWAFGLLTVKGEVSKGDERRSGNFTLGRVTRNFGEKSHVGLVIANSERDDGTYNRVGGVDSRLYLTRNISWTSQALGQLDQEKVITVDEEGYETVEFVDKEGYAYYSELRGGKKPFWWRLRYRDISEDFLPDFGFVRRRDVRGPDVELEFDRDVETGPIKKYGGEYFFTYFENHRGEVSVRDSEVWLGVTFRNEIGVWLGRTDSYHAPFSNTSTSIKLDYNQADEWHSVSGMYTWGVFENVSYDEWTLEKPVKLGKRVTTKFSGNFRRERLDEGAENVWLWRWVTEYTFPWEGRLKFTAEETSEERHNRTLLFSWPVRDNIDFHLVLTDAQTSPGEEQQGAFTKLVYRF